jgi:hypothetical protein
MGKEIKRVKAGSAQAQRLEQRIAFVQEYIKLWRQFFEMFSEGFENRKILKRDEEEFSRILNSLAHHHYRFTATTYPQMSGTDSILKVLCDVISLSHLKGLSDAQLGKIQIDWHTIFIDMNKALGRLIAHRPLTPEEIAKAKHGGPPPESEAPPPPPEAPTLQP